MRAEVAGLRRRHPDSQSEHLQQTLSQLRDNGANLIRVSFTKYIYQPSPVAAMIFSKSSKEMVFSGDVEKTSSISLSC